MSFHESRTDGGLLLLQQALQYLDQQAEDLSSLCSVVNAAPTNPKFQERYPETFYPASAYFDTGQNPTSPEIENDTQYLAPQLGHGSQKSPTIRESNEDDAIYKGETHLTERLPRLRLFAQNPENGDAGSNCIPALKDFSISPSQRYKDPTDTRPYALGATGTSAGANADLGFSSRSDFYAFDSQDTIDPAFRARNQFERHQSKIWGDGATSGRDIWSSNDLSPLIQNTASFGLDESEKYAKVDQAVKAAEFEWANKVIFPDPGLNRSPTVIRERRSTSAPLVSAITEDLQKLQNYFTRFVGEERLHSLPCSHGPSALSSIFAFIQSDDRKKAHNLPYTHAGKTCLFRCSACSMIACAGCGSKIDNLKVPFSNLSHSCIDSHLLSFVLVLAKIDARWQLKEFGPQNVIPKRRASFSTSAPSSSFTRANRYLARLSSTGARIGYSGTGYAAGSKYGSRKVTKTAAKIKQEVGDNAYLTELLGLLVELATDKAGELSMAGLLVERKDLLVATIRVSYLPELLGSLVRNGSIMDIEACNTWQMYEKCLDLLQVFSTYDPLLEFLVTPPQEKKSSPGIANLIKTVPDPHPLKGFALDKKHMGTLRNLYPVEFRLVEGSNGIGQSIIHSFQSLAKQCQAFMNNTIRIRWEDKDDEIGDLLLFCRKVGATAVKLDHRVEELKRKEVKAERPLHYRNLDLASSFADVVAYPSFSSSQTHSFISTPYSTNLQKFNPFEIPPTVRQECRHALSDHLRLKFSDKVVNTHCGSVSPRSRFLSDNSLIFSAAPSPGRMKRIIKELTVLSTTLPTGIYIRVQENRPEIFKALIAGPESSPYHLGLFEFDFTIPPNYPNDPPKVTFKTTGGGRVRFNPNLYETGKVCLSILGTWGGSSHEQWQPRTSTLLQVLVSLQSMIFCAEPYYNEPGYEQIFSPKDSKKYNEIVQFNNTRFGMTDWLEYPGLWDDVIQAHFLAYAEEMLSTTYEFVGKTSIDSPAPYTADYMIQSLMETAKNEYIPYSTLYPNMRIVMERAHQDLHDAMKLHIPRFLAAGLWEKTD
ncbi:hypothetical protein TWF751_010496 [Orbilia oligospora]|nr:hypothetical protein TWF751_010496 [Orbilia oligospora]